MASDNQNITRHAGIDRAFHWIMAATVLLLRERPSFLMQLVDANPTALIDLAPGQDVLDLGSGGGLDVLLSARRVAPDGIAIGLDMTDEMLELAEARQGGFMACLSRVKVEPLSAAATARARRLARK